MGYGAPGPEAIGPIESLAPSPGPGRARILGAPQVLRRIGNLAGPLAQMRIDAYKAGKDFNDAPVDTVDGAAGGAKVMAGPGAAAAAVP